MIRVRVFRIAALAAAVATLLLATAAPSQAAKRKYTSTARIHATVSVTVRVAVTVAATSSASIGQPVTTAQATAKASATSTARATGAAWARATRTASSKSAAKSRARAAALAAARRLATTRAKALAHARALVAARVAAQKKAAASAKAAATTKAHELVAAQPCGGSVPKSAGGWWTCTFDDEFNGTKLDSTKWLPVTSALSGATGGPACYTDSPNNISESGGVLNLTARKEAAPFTCSLQTISLRTQYTSGQVATTTKFAQTYGRFSIRAKFPAATIAGLQSSLWLWPQEPTKSLLWPASGEIDIAETYTQYPDRVFPYVHYLADPIATLLTPNTNVVTNTQCLISNVNAFHEYTLEWTKTTIRMLYDGQTCLLDNLRTLGASPFDQPYFIALTQALGIVTNAFHPTATPLPATTQIDWVRVWK